VALTPAGQKLVGVVEKQVGRELATLVKGLDEGETEQLASLASRVVSDSVRLG
jgi:GTP cyclohydrolase FolE2